MLALSTKSYETKVINYVSNQWQALLLYCDHRIADIDNKVAKRALRSVAQRRETFLFVYVDCDDKGVAAVHVLIGSV
ncbi:IS66 family transposase [Actimicrobium sp. CCC2.4]|uniref:IS66 family transposase n=1 Tax=Actimicrobium sp. CCC2.4 TaxID=3048606 RepID=UPI003A5992BA